MGARLFLFVQMEFPWELGPADGRYLLRGADEGDPEHVVVLSTLGAARRSALGSRRRGRKPADPEAELVATTRATIIDPRSLSSDEEARGRLERLDPEAQTTGAVRVLNRVLFAHRIASADPYLREVAPLQALVIRAGWGDGEHVAEGHWLYAHELPLGERRRARRTAALRPQERMAVLLGGRETALLCEEHTLRARLDMDQGRPQHAAIELERAYAAALEELDTEARPDLSARVEELRELQAGVIEAARAQLLGAAESNRIQRPGGASSQSPPSQQPPPGAPPEALVHAMERLEAALRARTAVGWSGQQT